ncbi:MAG TPA: hypothetical protein VJM12_06365 [Pyrinomonadaceae bacterium]|nr:hypothetical protein [Pyrinomonadaceae bacterium]
MKIAEVLLITLISMSAGLAGHMATAKANAGLAAATGGGQYVIGGSLDVQFGFSAIEHANGEFSGAFHHTTNDGLGSVDFDARVTCLAVDKELGRAWIGGVIVANRSTSPDFQAEIHQPGHDIWFRVLDEGNGQDNQEGRTTFVGFEGTIPSSDVYCATRPWPAENARTWPVVNGTITVH